MIEYFSSSVSLTQCFASDWTLFVEMQGGAVWEKPAGIDSWHDKFYPTLELWQEQKQLRMEHHPGMTAQAL